jgi:hypothetical protein
MTILPDLKAFEALKAQVAQLEAQLKAKGRLSFKVTEKGAVSVYGLQRFPVTLYAGQWERVIEALPELQAFMREHKGKLATKD